MAIISDFTNKKQIEKEPLHGKIIHHKRAVFYRVLLSLLVLFGIVATIYIQWKNKVYNTYRVTSTQERKEISNTDTMALGDGIITYSKDGISCTDIKGSAIWNQTFEMQDPLIETCDDVVAIGDYNGRTIYVMNSTEILGEINTTLPIKYFSVSSSGIVAAVLEDVDITRIYLYSSDGENFANFQTTMEKSGYPVAVSISANGEIVAVSYLFIENSTMITRLAFYNFGDVGQNENDNFVSGYDYSDTITPFLGFLDAETSFAIADSRIMFYKGKQKPVSDSEIILQDQVQSIFYGNGYVGLVFVDTSGESRYRIDIYNSTGSLVLQKKFDMEYSDILFTNENVLIYNSNESLLFNLDGVEKFKGVFEKQIVVMIPTTAINRFVLVGSNYIETIELE